MEREPTLTAILDQLSRIAEAVETLARPGADHAPDYVFPLDTYWNFDWSSIRAKVIHADQDGPTHVEWNGQVFKRRSPQNKFGNAIWYSRATGKDGEETQYVRLVTFREIKDDDVDPISAKISRPAAPRPTSQPGSNGAQKTPERPAPPPAPRPPINGPVSYAEYLRQATSQNIFKEAACWIAQQAGITDPAADHSTAARMLPYFYEVKFRGMKLTEGWNLLLKNEMDPEKAMQSLLTK